MLDLGDHPSRPVPGGGLVLEAPIADQRSVARPAAGPREQVLDGPLQDLVGREPDGVGHATLLQRFVEGRDGKGRVGSGRRRSAPGPCIYQNYRYTIITIVNGAQPHTEEAELWWQRLSDPDAKWRYFRRHVAATATEAARRVETDFLEWVKGQEEACSAAGSAS
jgi:hypothetical protein